MTKQIITRRRVLAGGAAIAAAGFARGARAQARALNVFGHRVHQAVATAGPGGDATEGFRTANNATINWITLGDNNAIHERLLREVSLGETSLDVTYLLNGRAVPRVLALFEPLNDFMRTAPIEDMADIAPGLVAPLRAGDVLHALPMRHATNALIYNEAIFEERGVAVPRSFEEMLEAARRLTFTRADGTPVVGLAFTPVFASNFLSLARAMNGDYMTLDRRIVAAEPPMVRTLEALAALFTAGALPRNIATLNNEEVTTWMQQGRAAMTINPFGRLVSYNDPAASRYPGKLKPMLVPMAADLAGRVAYAPTVEFWGFAIPKNSTRKALAWELVRALSSKAGTLAQALNGNGPVRVSTYAEARIRAGLPFAAMEAQAVGASRIHLPAFDEQARAHDIFVEESVAAMLGRKPAAQAMADATRRVQPLL